jgi:hypothetical protein
LIAAGALVTGVYCLALVLVSLLSRERVLPAGSGKRFCGLYLDCHRIVSLVSVDRADTIGPVRARGVFHIVTLRLASDARRATLGTGRLSAFVRDGAGRRVTRHQRAERALGPATPTGLPDTPLPPGGQLITRIVFDLPRDAVTPRLYVRDSAVFAVLSELFLLGDEDSFLHRPTTFALTEPRVAMRRPRPVCGATACDTVVRVLEVRHAIRAGRPADRVPADGVFYILTVEVTTRDGSGGEPSVEALVRDGLGRTWGRAADVEARLSLPAPGRRRWVFDLPDGIPSPRLEIRKPGVVNRLAAPTSIPLPVL